MFSKKTMFQNPVVRTDHILHFHVRRSPTSEACFRYIFQCDDTPFRHKPPSNFAAVLVELSPPQCPTAVKTRPHALHNACPECVTVVFFAIAPPRGPHRVRKPQIIHGLPWQCHDMRIPRQSLQFHGGPLVLSSICYPRQDGPAL